MKIVVGVDESPFAPKVLERAIEVARWREAELHVVHVVHLPVIYVEMAVDMSEVAEAQRAATWEALEPVLAAAGDIASERVDLDGYPPDRLVSYAAEVGADLIVVGTRGRGELAALVLGSTSHRVIHLAACDVLVVKTGR